MKWLVLLLLIPITVFLVSTATPKQVNNTFSNISFGLSE
jgi:hypothetical protein